MYKKDVKNRTGNTVFLDSEEDTKKIFQTGLDVNAAFEKHNDKHCSKETLLHA